jgi:outer membrane protein assembly factor BamB
MRCEQNADTLWTRVSLSKEHIFTDAACAAPDGGCYVGGFGGNLTGIIARLDARGDTIWVRRLTREWNSIEIRALCPTADGGVLAAARVLDEPPSLLRLSPQGDSLWTTTYNDSSISCIMAICPTADGWYLAGYTKEYRACIMRVGPQGERTWFWQRTSDTIETVLKSITLAHDGGAVACGYQATGGGINSGVFVRLSPEGESVVTRIARSPRQWYERIIPNGDGYVTVGSMTESYRWLVALERLSADGAVLDLKRFASSEDNYGYDVIAGEGDWLYAVGCSWPNKYFDIIHTRF